MTIAASLEQQIADLAVEPGTVACVWLGQAGCLFKSSAGTIVMVDPYLSEWALEQWGLKRVLDPPIDPGKLQPDLLLISHWHEDHLDAPLVKQWAKAPSPGAFVGPISCSSRALAWGWPAERVINLDQGQSRRIGDVQITATFARHETPTAPSPEAVFSNIE